MLDEPDGLPAAVLSPLPIFKYALALSAYADYGLILQFPKEDEVTGEDIFNFILDRLDRFPHHWVNDRIIIAAQAREKLDQNETVTPDELAALARVSRKSIMNLAAPGKGGVVLQKSSDDQITSESAMRWLLSRPDFRRSIWQQQKKTYALVLGTFRSRQPHLSSNRCLSLWLGTEAGFHRQSVSSRMAIIRSATATMKNNSTTTGPL
jgi:hypothetical protein